MEQEKFLIMKIVNMTRYFLAKWLFSFAYFLAILFVLLGRVLNMAQFKRGVILC